MTREEALQRLEGTWSFDLTGDGVLIRDVGLLSAVHAIRLERSAPSAREAVPMNATPVPGQGAAASGD